MARNRRVLVLVGVAVVAGGCLAWSLLADYAAAAPSRAAKAGFQEWFGADFCSFGKQQPCELHDCSTRTMSDGYTATSFCLVRSAGVEVGSIGIDYEANAKRLAAKYLNVNRDFHAGDGEALTSVGFRFAERIVTPSNDERGDPRWMGLAVQVGQFYLRCSSNSGARIERMLGLDHVTLLCVPPSSGGGMIVNVDAGGVDMEGHRGWLGKPGPAAGAPR